MPFDEEPEIDPPAVNSGLKINNKGSLLGEKIKKPSKEDFVEKASKINDQLNSYGEKALELATRFKKVLDDKTLPQNKTPFAIDAEKDILSELVQLGIDMNTDEYEQDCMGSMGLIMLLFRSILIQKDKINLLEYNLSLLEKKIKELLTANNSKL